MAGTIGRFRGWSSGEGKKTKLQRRAGPPEHRQHNLPHGVSRGARVGRSLPNPYPMGPHTETVANTQSRASVAIIHTSNPTFLRDRHVIYLSRLTHVGTVRVSLRCLGTHAQSGVHLCHPAMPTMHADPACGTWVSVAFDTSSNPAHPPTRFPVVPLTLRVSVAHSVADQGRDQDTFPVPQSTPHDTSHDRVSSSPVPDE